MTLVSVIRLSPPFGGSSRAQSGKGALTTVTLVAETVDAITLSAIRRPRVTLKG